MQCYTFPVKNVSGLNDQNIPFPTEKLGLLTLKFGLTDDQINELISYSQADEAVKAYTLDTKRFQNKQTYARWLSKGRSPYCLSDKEGKLLGLIWFRRANFPAINLSSEFLNLDKNKYQITLAVRTYGPARGKGLARSLIIKAYELYTQSPEYLQNPGKGVWITTSVHNISAVKTYRKVFVQVTDPDENGKILMVLLT